MPPLEHRFAHEAMGTTFEVFAWHGDRDALARAMQSAFDRIDHLEDLLSHWKPTSDVGRINAAANGIPVKVSEETFDCLRQAERAWKASSGRFDITIGALYAAWRDGEDRPREPTAAEIAGALARTGMGHLALDEASLTVTKAVAGLSISLGGIGKGFALDVVAGELREQHDITRTLWHSGHSTILAGDPPPDSPGWSVGMGGKSIHLARRSLSSSGTAVKGAHILDPFTGRPAEGRSRVWAFAPGGALSDAASTAAMLMSPQECARFQREVPGVSFVLTAESL